MSCVYNLQFFLILYVVFYPLVEEKVTENAQYGCCIWEWPTPNLLVMLDFKDSYICLWHLYVVFFFKKWLIFGGFLNTFCLRQLFYIFFHLVIKKKNQAANVIGIYSGGKGGVKRWICLAHITLDLKKDRSHLLTYL